MRPWRWRVKKFGPLPSSYISSISGTAKYSIKLCKYAADFASMLRFGLSALVFPNFINRSALVKFYVSQCFVKDFILKRTRECNAARLRLCKYTAGPASDFASMLRSTPPILQVRCGPASDFASVIRSTPQTLQVRCGPSSNFASALRSCLNLCLTAAHLQSLRRGPHRTCKV